LGFLAARIRTIAWIPIARFAKFYFSKKKKKHVELKLGHSYKSLIRPKKKKNHGHEELWFFTTLGANSHCKNAQPNSCSAFLAIAQILIARFMRIYF
jgi:hypothetical protein